VWVRLLTVPYRYLYPSGLLFICIGVFSSQNDFFPVGETLVIGIIGYILLRLDFHPAPLLLGFVLGTRFEENLRRALLLSHGDVRIFLERPISAAFLVLAATLITIRIVFVIRRGRMGVLSSKAATDSDWATANISTEQRRATVGE
jgi:TctA family transporter